MLKFIRNTPIIKTVVRTRTRERRTLLSDLYKRRLEIGPEEERHRSVWSNWNYEAELFAFSKRLNENFRGDLLRQAFTHDSYLAAENQRRLESGIDQLDAEQFQSNSALTELGRAETARFVACFLRHAFPHLPEEWIAQLVANTLHNDTLAFVSSHIGTRDLILMGSAAANDSAKSLARPTNQMLADTLLALIGALRLQETNTSEDDNEAAEREEKNREHRLETSHRTHLFIRDFVCAQVFARPRDAIIGEQKPTLLDSISIQHASVLLDAVLKAHDQPSPAEPRLISQSAAANRFLANYTVGVYSGGSSTDDRVLLGISHGETLAVAKEEAAADALRKLFGFTHCEASLAEMFREGELPPNLDFDRRNVSLQFYLSFLNQ